MTVYCLVELDGVGVADVSLRALTFARGLANGLVSPADARLAAVVFGEPPAADLGCYGVSEVIAVSGIDGYAPQAWARALAALLANTGLDDTGLDDTGLDDTGLDDTGLDDTGLDDTGLDGTGLDGTGLDGTGLDGTGLDGATAVVAAATDRGNEVLAHLGAITGLPMAANCVAVSPAADGGYALVRQRWAGLLLEDALLDGPVALLTVATDAVSAETRDTVPDVSAETSAAPVVHRVLASVNAADLVVRAVETSSGAGGASLATARVVVGGGRGVGSAAGFAPLEELAALLGGVVGVSRVVTSEGWRPHSMQVGQTGTKITPDLYLACGISGAIQHIAGCSGAKHLIAINKDPAAPMVTRADYAVIGDLHEIVPALVQAIKDRADR
jgi:electron transfer flavoprotein alpha subunit